MSISTVKYYLSLSNCSCSFVDKRPLWFFYLTFIFPIVCKILKVFQTVTESYCFSFFVQENETSWELVHFMKSCKISFSHQFLLGLTHKIRFTLYWSWYLGTDLSRCTCGLFFLYSKPAFRSFTLKYKCLKTALVESSAGSVGGMGRRTGILK